MKSSDLPSGDLPSGVNSTSYGSLTGRSFSGTGTIPQSSQYITGIGAPQYLCLDTSQSLNLKLTFIAPSLSFSSSSTIAFLASAVVKPSNLPELTSIPCSQNGSSGSLPALSVITLSIGKLNLLAKAKSLSSCAGTAITHPVPYVANT